MIRQWRAEVLKVASLWSTWVLVGVSAVAATAFGTLIGFAPRRRETAALALPPHGTPGWFDNLFSAMSIAQTLALVIGVLAITGEYRHKTITSTYLATPRRGRVVTAKLINSAGWGGVTAVAAGAGCLVLGFCVVLAGNGTSSTMLTEFGHVFPGVLLASILFALYGVGLGALLRNQVVALVVALAFTAVVEPIVVAAVPSVGRYLPGQAAQALSSVTARAGAGFGARIVHLLPWWGGGGMLLVYAVVLSVAGSLTTLRADVT
jgi:ABC-type transport system involved in multi-copper enzyme maturation permease subunit